MSIMTRTCERRGAAPLDARRLRKITVAVAIWGLWAAAIFCWHRDLVNLLFGPFPLDGAVLCAVTDPDQIYQNHVRLEGDRVDRLFPSAFTLGQEPYAYCGLLHIDDKCLLIQMPAGQDGRSVTGLLEPFTPFEKEFVVERWRAKNPGKELLPFRLNMTRPFWFGVVYFRIMPLALLLAAAIWRTIRASSRTLQA